MKFLNNLLSIVIYGVIFFGVIYFSGFSITISQNICVSFILAFFAGMINNIERVLRELFDKNYNKKE